MVFFYIDDKRKLELIKYNKAFQDKLNINIIHYKLFSKKYLIFETERKSREYNKDNGYLIYEGEYLNGKRNGKGKEYNYLGELIFEGEYYNGKRNGKGKEYECTFGKLLFEGEYLNGKRWNGKRYYENEIAYELKNGKGVLKQNYVNSVRLKYEIEYLNEKTSEKRKEYNTEDEPLFEGE